MATVTKTRTYNTGDTLTADNYNDDRDEVISGINSVVNAQVDASAAIAYSKLSLSTSILNADISASAAIAYSKLDLTGAILNADLAGSIAASKITDTAVTLTATQTLTNKRITKRITTIVSNAAPTVDTDDCDAVTITALTDDISSMTTNLSGTPTNFQTLVYRILDDGSGQTISWGASFQAMGIALPTSVTASKVLTVGFIYDTVDSKWGCVAVSEEI